MKNKIVKFGSFLGLALIGVSVSTTSNLTSSVKTSPVAINNQAVALKEAANDYDEYTVLWDNDNNYLPVSWNNHYIFGKDTGQQDRRLAIFQEDVWENVIKHGTFYLDYRKDGGSEPDIWVVDSWWQNRWDTTGHIEDNHDGTYRLELTFEDSDIVDSLDERGFLFTGGGNYIPLRLYYGTKPDMTGKHYINIYKRESEKRRYHAHLSTDKLYTTSGDTVTLTVNYLDPDDSFPYELNAWDSDSTSVVLAETADPNVYTFTMPDADVNITGEFKDNDFTASFYMSEHGSSQTESQSGIAYDSTIVEPEEPTDNLGWVFMNWYKDGDHNSLWHFDTDKIKCNTVLYAYWEEILGIEMRVPEQQSFKTDYEVGEDIDLSNVTIEVYYMKEDGPHIIDKKPLPEMIKGYDKYKSGKQIISLNYNGVSMPLSVFVADFDVSLKTKPAKLEYAFGEDLDLTGAKLTLTSKGETSKTVDIDVTPDMVSGYDKAKAGIQTITVTLDGKTATFDVTVVDSVTSISIKSTPTKTAYVVGEELDLTGAKLERVLKSGKVEEIDVTSTMVSGYDKTKIGTQTLTVTLDGKTVTFTVTVTDPTPAPTPTSGGISTGALVGAIIGSVVGGAAIALGITFLILKKKKVQ